MRQSVLNRVFWRIRCASVLIASLALTTIGVGQDDLQTNRQATSVSDDSIPIDNLKVILRPLTKDELEIELGGWLELLRGKIREVGETELSIKTLSKDESGEQLKEQLLALRNEEIALVNRVQVVIDALKSKGGDGELAQTYVNSVSSLGETTDVTSYWAALSAAISNWIRAEDGGILMAKRIILALIILLVFWLISKFAGRAVAKVLSRHPRASNLLENFARRTTGGVVFVVGALMAVAALGVQIGPLMAALGAGGFIVGFALQETLGSFASGLMIMVYRPFDVDDYISVAGVSGTVKEMSLVSTTLLTIDNKVLVIPNKKAWGDTITNYTGKDIRRVDLVFGIGYDDDIQQAIDVLKEIANEHQLILEDPPLTVHVDELADSSVNLFCRPWVKTENYWTVHWDLTRQVKERFDAEGISIPYPQRDVHMQTESISTS